MPDSEYLVIYTLEDRNYGIPVSHVTSVLPAAEVTPVPDARGDLLGLLDLQGEVVPVVDLHRRCGFTPRPTRIQDHFLLVAIGGKRIVLRVDSVSSLILDASRIIVEPEHITPGMLSLAGIVPTENGIVLIPDFASLLSRELETAETLAKEHS